MDELKADSTSHFDETEMKEILESFGTEEKKVLSKAELDKIVKAWSSVEKKKIYGQKQ